MTVIQIDDMQKMNKMTYHSGKKVVKMMFVQRADHYGGHHHHRHRCPSSMLKNRYAVLLMEVFDTGPTLLQT